MALGFLDYSCHVFGGLDFCTLGNVLYLGSEEFGRGSAFVHLVVTYLKQTLARSKSVVGDGTLELD